MKFIREGRFGPPFSWKTGAAGTYPKPMLFFCHDSGGLDIITDYPITWISPCGYNPTETPKFEPGSLAEACMKKPEELPPITAIDFSVLNRLPLETLYRPTPDKDTFEAVTESLNLILKLCPWKTFVYDHITGLSDCIYGHQAVKNAAELVDARKWAGKIGLKVDQIIKRACQFQCHTVFLFHSENVQNEDTKEAAERPMLYSKLRDFVGARFSQFFYAYTEGQKAYVRTQPHGLIKGIGARWPLGLPAVCKADYKSIYETNY